MRCKIKKNGMSATVEKVTTFRFLFHDVFSAVPARFPVSIVEAVYTDAFAGGYVNELIFAEVNAAVRRAFLIRGKKDEIAGLKFGTFFNAFAKLILFVGSTGERKTVLLENVLDES